ncbi:hypothetical protein BCR35DRAFT_351051 [Leucosporidium creatinivorum]|uniref:Uncharacterized protein n=1 Tax=Leucosporidium creatinivorum TaxID=106004 RepID=A0A1Y2FW33_9BASI|nr:hypothetical protein BCR35DRAFT_351051 [Leucosporidium creatinivorum]
MSVTLKQVQGTSCTGNKQLQWSNLPASLQVGPASGRTRLAFGTNNVVNPPSVGFISGTQYNRFGTTLFIDYWTMKYAWAGTGTGRYISVSGTLTNANGYQTATTTNSFVVSEPVVPTMCYFNLNAFGAMLNGAKMAGAFSRTQARMQVSSYGRTNNGNVYLLNALFVGNLASGPTVFAAGVNTTNTASDDLSTAFPDFDFSEMGDASLSNLTLPAEQPAELAQSSTSGAARTGSRFAVLLGALLAVLAAMLAL